MSIGKETDSPWNQIDAIPVVNLDNRPERWNLFIESAKGIIPVEKLTRFSASLGTSIPGYGVAPWFHGKATDTRWAARAGCTLSHQRIMVEATQKGWNTILILEDDADFSQTNSEELTQTLQVLLSKRSSWDICYLGFSKAKDPSQRFDTVGSRDLFVTSGCATTHAYLINLKARDWLSRKLPSEDKIWQWTAKHRIIDRWYSWNLSLNLKVIAVSPSIITQMEGFSDIVGGEVDYKNEFPGKVTRAYDSRSGFIIARLKWRAKGIATLIHDTIRYFIKRIKGF